MPRIRAQNPKSASEQRKELRDRPLQVNVRHTPTPDGEEAFHRALRIYCKRLNSLNSLCVSTLSRVSSGFHSMAR